MDRDDAQIVGALFLSLGQVCTNYNFLIDHDVKFLQEIKPEGWYSLEKFLNIMDIVEEKYSDPDSIFEQIGIEMMNLWYQKGEGQKIVKNGSDFLRFQTSSNGYYSVIKGSEEKVGDFSLVNIDETKGMATVKSTTPFNRNLERGILIGGMGLTKELIYINVDNSKDENVFKIVFKNSEYNVEIGNDVPSEIIDKQNITTLYWKHKMLEENFRRYSNFWNSTNTTLSETIEKLGSRDKVIKERSKELLQTNALLENEIIERKLAQKRTEQINKLKEDLFEPISLEKKLKRITDGIVEIFKADFARLWITKPGDLCNNDCYHAKESDNRKICINREECLHLMVSSGRFTKVDGEVQRRIPFGTYKIGQIASGKITRFLTNDMMHDPRVFDNEWARKQGIVAFAGYRLLSEAEKPIGVIAVFSKHVLSREDDGLLEGLANTTAQVIQNASAEEELKLYQVMIESAHDVIFYKDLKSRYIIANDRTIESFGLTKDEVIGKNDFELMSDLKEAQQNVLDDQTVFHSKRTTEFNKHMTGGDEHEYWFNAVKVPQFDDSGNVKGLVGIARDITKLKITENALRESEAELRALFEGMPDVVLKLDYNGYYLKIANTSPDLLFRPEDELKGKNLHDVFPKEKADFFLNRIRNSLKTNKLVKIEYNLEIGGTERWFDGRIAPMTDKEVVFVARDITSRKKAEETLRESEEKYRAIFENATDIIIIAQDGKIAFANPAFEKILGFSSKDTVARPFTDFIHPDDRTMVFERYIRRMTGEDVETGYQFRALTSTGAIKWVIINSCALDWDGKPSTLNFLTDMTARKEIEEVLKQSEGKLRSILESSPDGIGVSNLNGEIIDCNQSMLEMHGYNSKEEVLGKSAFIFVKEHDHKRAEKNFEKTLKEGNINNIEYTFVRKDGSLFPVELSLSTIRDSLDKPMGLVAVARDISTRKQKENELQRAIEVAEESKSEAEAANKAKSIFLANISHELRTPLNSILGYTQILKRDKKLHEKQLKAIEIIHSSSEHLLNLINELLDLSRIEAQKMELELSDVYLPNFLEGITELAKIRAHQENVPINFDIAPNIPKGVCVDEKRLRQVLLNLINNAIKFAESGTVEIKIKRSPLEYKDTNNPIARIHFEIEDTGVGISENELEKIFLPFHQVNKTKLTTEGTGLGLPISRNLLKIMGSKLNVKSEIEKGTTFWFDLDLPVAQNISTTLNGKDYGYSKNIISYKGEKRKILIADDNDKNRSILADILIPLGFEITEVSNGMEAVNTAKEISPDCILMDLVMPVMDGLEAVKQIRKIKAIKEKTIIAISASALKSQKEISIEAGCNTFLAKPILIDELLEYLEKYLKLDWIYDETKENKTESNKSDILIPSAKELNTLLKFAEVNHITGLKKTLEEIKNSDEKLIPFTEKIESYLENFQFKKIIEIVKIRIKEAE